MFTQKKVALQQSAMDWMAQRAKRRRRKPTNERQKARCHYQGACFCWGLASTAPRISKFPRPRAFPRQPRHLSLMLESIQHPARALAFAVGNRNASAAPPPVALHNHHQPNHPRPHDPRHRATRTITTLTYHSSSIDQPSPALVRMGSEKKPNRSLSSPVNAQD